MNTNAKKQRKPVAEQNQAATNKAAPPKPPAQKNPQETSARKKELRKQRKMKKTKINVDRIYQFRTKIHAGDQEARSEIEKIVAKLSARNAKSKRGHRKLNLYKNMLSGKFSLEKNTQNKSQKIGNKKPPAQK